MRMFLESYSVDASVKHSSSRSACSFFYVAPCCVRGCLLAFFVRFAAVWVIALMLLLVLYASLLCCALLYCCTVML